MPVSLNDNSAARISEYDEKSIVFYSYSLNATANAQSLASLMNSLSERGYKVHLITYGQPAGDDYISADNVERHILSTLENDGMPSSVSLLRVLGSIPAKRVVLWGSFTKRTYQCYLAAKSLGRCVIFYQTSAPYQALSAGGHNLLRMYNNVVCGCDLVITPCDSDKKVFEGLGAPGCRVIPFFFPYDESEVSPSSLEGRKVAMFTSFAGGNVRKIISAFALLHEKYTDATMHIIVMKSVKQSGAVTALIDYVNNSGLGDSLTIETNVLKPLRQLRDAAVSVTYAHLEHMPQTVMESVTAGIPAVNAYDADYSDSSLPSLCVNAADTQSIYSLLEKYMDKDERLEYQKQARKNLTNQVREDIADLWEDALNSAQAGFDSVVEQSAAVSGSITAALKSDLSVIHCTQVIKKAAVDGASQADIFGAMLYSGVSQADILKAAESAGIYTSFRSGEINDRLKFINVIDKELKKKKSPEEAVKSVKKGIYSGFEIETMMAFSKVGNDDIRAALGITDDNTLRYVFSISFYLLNSLYNDDVKIDGRIIDTHDDASLLGIRNAENRFITFNERGLKFKNHFFVRYAIKFHRWLTSPWDFKSRLAKIICAPVFARSLLKKNLLLAGRKRQNKRKVVEVDPADTRKIQLLVLMLLLELDRICKKYDLTYYIAGGSILGAVRHKGFIPWDDDIDITMPRPDYDKFIKVAQKELPEEYYLDKDCVPFCHNRIEIRGTDFTTFWRKGAVFLDILALEGAPDDEKLRREHERKCKFWRSCMLEKARPFPVFDFSSKKKIKRYICCSILRFVPRWFIKKNWERWAKKYDPSTTGDWVCLPASIYTYDQETFPKEYWGKPVYLDFEGMKLPTMSHWEDYLVCHFGDYMKLPPVTTRKSHHFIYSYTLGKYGEMPVEDMEKMYSDKRAEYGMECKG